MKSRSGRLGGPGDQIGNRKLPSAKAPFPAVDRPAWEACKSIVGTPDRYNGTINRQLETGNPSAPRHPKRAPDFARVLAVDVDGAVGGRDRKSTRLNSSHR